MNICVFGDSVAKGVIYDETIKKYVFLKDSFVNLFSRGFHIPIKNFSKFGCTILKGKKILEKNSKSLPSSKYTVLEFGGNDCNYNWEEIAANPEKEHLPAVSPGIFKKTYSQVIEEVKTAGSIPVLFSLPPLNAKRFFEWVSRGLNKENILSWLGDIDFIYRWQESYNSAVLQIAKKHDVPLVDIRKAFLENRRYNDLICIDGMHPSKQGHALINGMLADLAF